jgi:hypothetical protein
LTRVKSGKKDKARHAPTESPEHHHASVSFTLEKGWG